MNRMLRAFLQTSFTKFKVPSIPVIVSPSADAIVPAGFSIAIRMLDIISKERGFIDGNRKRC